MQPKVCSAQPFLSRTTCLRRMSLGSDTLHLLGSSLSGNPSSSCMFLPIHSSSLDDRYWSTGWCLRYAYLSYTVIVSVAPKRSILSDATAATLNGFRSSRSRLTAPLCPSDLPVTVGETDISGDIFKLIIISTLK